MTSTLSTSPTTVADAFDSLDPATGAVLSSWPVHTDEQVRTAVASAHEAARWWGELGFAGRGPHLTAWKGELARGMPELAGLVHAENGKPVPDAVIEITLAVGHLAWATKNARRVLGSRRIRSGLLAANQASTLEYPPLGVVGVIGPWNYPVFTPMGSLAYALAAGNAVVFKPSEHTPAIGAWLVDAWKRAVPDAPDVLQLITGFGPTGAALCRAGVDKIAFTGSAATGRKVMAACSEGLVPVLMECGGKDAMIVGDGADVRAAADAALWGAMSNAGQTCTGIERVYVTDASYDAFVTEIAARAAELTPGAGTGASYGPITMPGQVDVIRRHLADAIESGGRVLTGGTLDGRFVAPTVLVDVPETSTAVTEETFGPTVTVTHVPDVEEALRRSNATSYGLAGSVFAASSKAGVEIARRMRTGMTSVNAVIAFAAVPGLPFGGVGESGFGRVHGDDGLREFTRAKAITRQRFALPVPLTSFQRPEKVTGQLVKAVKLLHGRG
jgi:aldehyde dehydrogenase (NAD+)